MGARLPLPACGERSVPAEGGNRVRGRIGGEGIGYGLQHAIHIARYLMIPETQDAVAVFVQPLIPHDVPFAVRVLAAIDFDDQPFLAANKIDNIATERLLAHKPVTFDRTGAKLIPKAQLGIR